MPAFTSIMAGIGAAVGIGSGIAKLAESGDQRPSLGGPGSLGSQTSQSLAKSFTDRPTAENPGLTQPAITGMNVPDLGGIRQNMNIIGQRLGIAKQTSTT